MRAVKANAVIGKNIEQGNEPSAGYAKARLNSMRNELLGDAVREATVVLLHREMLQVVSAERQALQTNDSLPT